MLRVPTVYCLTPGRTSVAKFIPHHEVPLIKRQFAGVINPATGTRGVEVGPIPADTPIDFYWHTFASPGAELGRLRAIYTSDLVDSVYPVEAEFFAVIENALERAAGQTIGPADPALVPVPEDLVLLITEVGYEGDAPALARDFATRLGLRGAADLAASTLSALCSVPSVDPGLAKALREAARANAQDLAESIKAPAPAPVKPPTGPVELE
jgi:hypothetical protein